MAEYFFGEQLQSRNIASNKNKDFFIENFSVRIENIAVRVTEGGY